MLCEFATPPEGVLAYAQQVRHTRLQLAVLMRLPLMQLSCTSSAAWHDHVLQPSAEKPFDHPHTHTRIRPVVLLPLALQMLAPFGALLSRRLLTPMTDNACVSIHAVGPAAAHSNSNGATVAVTNSSSSSKSGVDELSADEQLQLMAITEDPWGSYLVHPDTLETLKQVGCCVSHACVVRTCGCLSWLCIWLVGGCVISSQLSQMVYLSHTHQFARLSFVCALCQLQWAHGTNRLSFPTSFPPSCRAPTLLCCQTAAWSTSAGCSHLVAATCSGRTGSHWRGRRCDAG